jgi:hypothetical protein
MRHMMIGIVPVDEVSFAAGFTSAVKRREMMPVSKGIAELGEGLIAGALDDLLGGDNGRAQG